MNGLEEIQKSIENFICEKKKTQQQIAKIEEKRLQLSQERNEKKKIDCNDIAINELGKQINELGIQSQELQNKLDSNFCEVKRQVDLGIDNLIAEGIRRIRIENGEIEELKGKNAKQRERNLKYKLQRQEFYERFGRMPELSENAIKENRKQETECIERIGRIKEITKKIEEEEANIVELAKIKKEFRNGNWNFIQETKCLVEDISIEAVAVEELEPIEEIFIEEFEPVEEMYVEEFVPIEEIHVEEMYVEEFKEIEESGIETLKIVEEEKDKNVVDEIEKLANSIVDEIVSQQTAKLNVNKIEEEEPEDIIVFEKEPELEEQEQSKKVKIPLFGQQAIISNITVKIEEKQLVYKAQMSDGKEIKIYPSKIGEENVLLRDKQNRKECEKILIDYATNNDKLFNKKVVDKIDPLICELLIECATRYNYNAKELIFNYAVSFVGKEEPETVPGIIYNISYLEGSNLSKKEKSVIKRICRKSRGNDNIDIIESFTSFKKIKYIFKRLFAVNNIKVLPEAKY